MSEGNRSAMSEQPDFHQEITGAEYAATSATGNASIQIYNYYYGEKASIKSADSVDEIGENLPCPYRGLFHFGPDNAEYFFGREVFVEELFAATQNRNFIPVLGASGSGKSSVVLAGLVPKLQKSGHWLFTHFRPRSDPFHSLALALIRLYTENLDATDRIVQTRKLAKSLCDGEISLADVFAQIHQNHPTNRVLLIVDQFEELYTLCADREIRHSFLDTLLNGFQSSDSQSQFDNVLVATMRVDFLGKALSYRPFADLLQNADIKLGPMNHDELSQVIVKPAEKLGVTFETGLVERILDDLDNELGNLPLLEFALTQLWEQRTGKQLTHAAYEKIGEVQGALARHADRNYHKLSLTEQEQVRGIFIQLVRPGEGTKDTRRLATKAQLNQDSWGLVKKLADARLVVTSRNSADQETVEVVHEALIHHWGELRQWMRTDRNFRAWQERLRASMYQWEQVQKDEGALLRGAALADAQEKLKQRPEDLSEDEENFIEASVALRDRELLRRSFERRFAFSILAGGLALTLGLFGFAYFEWQQSEKTLLKQSNALAKYSLELFHQGKNLDALVEALRAGIPLRNRKANLSKQIGALQVLYEVEERNRLEGHRAPVESVEFSPNGKIIATASKDRTVKLWNLQGKEIQTIKGHREGVGSVAFSPNGKIIATASEDKTVKLWNLQGKEIQTLKGHREGVGSVAFSPNGKIIATASKDKTVKLWNLQGQEIKTLKGHGAPVGSLAFSPDGKTIASGSGDKTVKLWNLQGQEIKTLKGHSAVVRSVAFSPDGKTIASGSRDKTVKLWSLQGQEIKTLEMDGEPVESVTFSPDSKTIVSVSDKNVNLWSLQGQEIKIFRAHGAPNANVAFSPVSVVSSKGSSYIMASTRSNNVKLWNLNRENTKILKGHSDRVKSVAFSPVSAANPQGFGNTMASASQDKTVKLWNLQGQVIKTLKGHRAAVESVAFSPNGNIIASASQDKTVKLWNFQGQVIKTLEGHSAPVKNLAFSPVSGSEQGFGNTIASASADKTVKLWNLQGQLIKTLIGHRATVESVAFSPDSKTIASGSADRTVKLWNLQNQEIKISIEHGDRVESIAFSPDGKTIASAGGDKVRLWDLQGREIATFGRYGAPVESVTFSPDGKSIASAGGGKVKMWNLQGQEIVSFEKHRAPVANIAFSPDGKTIASASADKTIKLWSFDLDLDSLLVEGCNWVRDYLKYNAGLSEEDRRLCDRVELSHVEPAAASRTHS